MKLLAPDGVCHASLDPSVDFPDPFVASEFADAIPFLRLIHIYALKTLEPICKIHQEGINADIIRAYAFIPVIRFITSSERPLASIAKAVK